MSILVVLNQLFTVLDFMIKGLKTENNFERSFIKYQKVQWEKSSTKVIRYFDPKP